MAAPPFFPPPPATAPLAASAAAPAPASPLRASGQQSVDRRPPLAISTNVPRGAGQGQGHGARVPAPSPRSAYRPVGQAAGLYSTAAAPSSAAPASAAPASAAPASAAPSSAAPAYYSPSLSPGAMAYNPQDWRHGGGGGDRGGTGGGGTQLAGAPSAHSPGAYIPHTAALDAAANARALARARGTQDMTGMEGALPSPPPPYTAASGPLGPSLAQVAQFPQFSHTLSPLSAASEPAVPTFSPLALAGRAPTFPLTASAAGSALSPGPAAAPPTAFPPPPSTQRDRSGSRTRAMLSSISAMSGMARHRGDAQGAGPDYAPRHEPQHESRHERGASAVPRAAHRASYYADLASTGASGILGGAPGILGSAPAARRSVSTGYVSPPSRAASQDRNRAANWQLGMPLPPPPPGGPPGSRSHSVDRSDDHSGGPPPQFVAAPKALRQLGTVLGPIPPTPADWRDDDAPRAPSPSPSRPDTTEESGHLHTSQPSAEPRFGRMAPARARDASAKGIRQRRIESRSASRLRDRDDDSPVDASPEAYPDARPANLVLATTARGVISRRRHVPKSATSPRAATLMSPGSPSVPGFDPPDSARSASSAAPGLSGPLSPLSGLRTTATISSPATPFTPGAENASAQEARFPSSAESLPLSAASVVSPKSGASDRDYYTPLNIGVSPAASQAHGDFFQASLDRYRKCLDAESSAPDDAARLEVFAQFFVAESRLRRDRYAAAFDGMGSDVLDLTRDLWRSHGGKRSKAASASTAATPADRDAIQVGAPRAAASPHQAPSSASSSNAPFTPFSEDLPSSQSSPASNARKELGKPAFEPSLSPILSMAMSTGHDEESSRGRAASRWWEHSDSQGSVTNGGRKLELSKRESKYMGVPRQTLADLQWDGDGEAGPSSLFALGPGEYPPEKVAYDDSSTPSATGGFRPAGTPTPSNKLDISRLVTLPPPYPRHHPAVNNNHPELAALRAVLRGLTETVETQEFAGRYATEKLDVAANEQDYPGRRSKLRQQIQARVGSGTMSFAEAADAEKAFDDAESARAAALAKHNFTTYQRIVLQPLSAIFKEKINTAAESIDQLKTSLLDSASTWNPNITQESGDELPELLEKVTLMKWLFEAREQLHADLFAVQSESDRLYGHVMLAPYKLAGNQAKVAEVESFFAGDRKERHLVYANDAQARYERFLATVEDSVMHGVEAQLSAFWDIAPALVELVDKVPAGDLLGTLAVLVPQAELDENPAYGAWPLQYLYTLLAHAGKSTYQFIESQTNLLCLLHEIKTAAAGAALRAVQAARSNSGRALGADDAANMARASDAALTKELKERVGLVEDQWQSSVGGAVEACRARIGAYLRAAGGWDESLDE